MNVPVSLVPHMPRFKVCCISSHDEARLAISAGASALGLVSEMPSGPGVIDEALIADIAAATPPGVDTFLLTSRTSVAGIVEQHRRCAVTTIQLCDELDVQEVAELRQALPGVRLVPVVHVVDDSVIERATALAEVAHALLLDTGNPKQRIKELGGTGRVHDWSVSRRITEAIAVPVFLAGGLTPNNVGRAIARVQPWAVDVCSGVRRENRLVPDLLESFTTAMRRGAHDENFPQQHSR